MGTLSPILVRQSVDRCRLLLPITGVTLAWRQGPRLEPLDYSSPASVSQVWDDKCNQKRVARTALVLRSG
jgi:hypothetical protein